MPKTSKPGYYAVRKGRAPGIYLSWPECEAQVKGFTGAVYKKLATEAEAVDFLAAKPSAARVPIASTSRLVPAQENDCDVVYCDGACKGNGQPGSIAGVGVWWGHDDPRNISERCPGGQTNNRAELIAIVRILETTPRLRRTLLIKTDSNYSIQCVTSWIFNWMRNGFLAADGKPVKNRALIKYLVALLHARRKSSQTIEFEHVRGHVGIQGNEAADQLANLGATKPTVPERDWEKLETQVLQSLKPVSPLRDDLKACADGLLNDAEMGETGPSLEPRRQHSENQGNVARDRVVVFPAPHNLSPPRANALVTTSRLVEMSVVRNKRHPSSRDTSRPTAQAPPKKLAITISREELEVFASCLLGDDELSRLGKDGVFDSDF